MLDLPSISRVRGSQDQDGLCSQSTRGLLHLLLGIALCMVDENLRSALQSEILLIARINTNAAKTHTSGSNLESQMSQTSSGTQNSNPVARLGRGLPQCTVDGHTCTELWSRRVAGERLGDGCDVVRRSEDVLLEGAWSVISRNLLVEADSVVSAQASWTGAANGCDPFDSNAVADFDGRGLGSGAHLLDNADT